MLPPPLPPAPSWYPGHMSRFTRLLPALLKRTQVVIELRDARLPLTSVNPAFEGTIGKWQNERRKVGVGGIAVQNNTLCERIIVLGKKDLVGQWGIQPFRKAMKKYFPGDHIHFTSHMQPWTVKELSNLVISMASQCAELTSEVNVLVIGMPNVGKSTLLNALRHVGIPGPTPKALRTSAQPGLTRALSTRLKLSQDPLVYAFDSPGIMVPFLGRGDLGAERGVKLALIAGIKEGLYDIEELAAYLMYRLWVLNPHSPAYMTLLPPSASPPSDIYEFLGGLAVRLGMLQKGGEHDLRRAALWFIKWWREDGGLLSDGGLPRILSEKPRHCHISNPQHESSGSSYDLLEGGAITLDRFGWGFDFEWDMPVPAAKADASTIFLDSATIQILMEERIEAHLCALEQEKLSREDISLTQEKKLTKEEKVAKRRARVKKRN